MNQGTGHEAASPVNAPHPGEASAAEVLLVQRIAQSDGFRRAPRLCELLLFLTERAIHGHTAELNEHEIALGVFRRSDTFNPADDSIVRSSARQLRTKLREYFEGPGKAESIVIEIPKGGYVPEFLPRAPALPQTPSGTARMPWKWAAVASTLVAMVLASLLVRNTIVSSRTSPHKQANLVTSLFAWRGLTVNVVLCDSALVIVNAHRPHVVSLDDYIQQDEQRPLALPNGKSSGATPPDFPGKRLITSFRDISFVTRLSEASVDSGFHIHLEHSRLMQVRDFRSGNYILLGSAWSDPWTTLFEEHLNFRFAEQPDTGYFGLENVKPAKGEQHFYWCSPEQAHNGVSCARIAIVPNLGGDGTILLLSGLHTESSEGVIDSALSPSFLDKVEAVTGIRNPRDLVGLKLLLEVRAVDGVVQATSLLATRTHSL